MGSLIQNTVFGRSKKVFVSTWRTSNTSTGSSTSTQVKLPLISTGTYNFRVDWGDGLSDTITTWNQAQVTHNYSSSGDYIIKITGNCIGWSFNNIGDRLKILSVLSWGSIQFANVTGAFWGCANINLTTISDTPDLTGSNLTNTFSGCTTITTIDKLDVWNMSVINSLSGMFNGCSNFNQNLGTWNVVNVVNFSNTFNNCINFNNGDSNTINNWIISTASPVAFSAIFFNCRKFNQPLDNWNTSRVTTLEAAFYNCLLFNQNIGNWNIANVTNLSSAFSNSGFNNGDSNTINNWNTSNVINMTGVFAGSGFNQNISSWNTTKVTNMASMFRLTNFNQNIGSWNTKNVTDMSFMFSIANSFNQPLDSWDVSKVSTFSGMFNATPVFNQPLGSWNTGLAINMENMFFNAKAFNQNIGSWNISNVTGMSLFMNGKTPLTFSTANLDAIYNTTTGWASRPVKPSIAINFGTAKYTAAGSAGRVILTGAPNNWVITDGGI